MIIGLFPFFIKIIQLEDKFAWVLVAAVADFLSVNLLTAIVCVLHVCFMTDKMITTFDRHCSSLSKI